MTGLNRQAETNLRSALFEAAKAKKGDPKKGWGEYGSDHYIYAQWFGLPKNFFQKRIEAKRKNGGQVCGLDVMSNTAFLGSLGISGVAIGLTLDENEAKNAALHNRYLVAGDLLKDRKRIWPEVDGLMRQHGLEKGFDIITLRGLGGMCSLTDNPVMHFLLLQEMWKRLAVGGILLTQVPPDSHYILQNLSIMDYWNTIPGIEVRRVRNGIIFEKSQEAPALLPLNFSPLFSVIKRLGWNPCSY